MRYKKRSFSLLELIIVMSVMIILAGASSAMISPYTWRRNLELSAEKLTLDLMEAQQYSLSFRDGYQYYGIFFYDNLQDGESYGYKLVRYKVDETGALLFDTDGKPIIDVVIKSSETQDNPEYLENTAFPGGVEILATSEIQIGDFIIFNSLGSATNDGDALLSSTQDEITFQIKGITRTVKIHPLTGYVEQG